MLTYTGRSKEGVSCGISTCQGCMIDVIFRNVVDIMGKDMVLVIPPGCAAQFSGCGPEAAVTLAGVQGNLENSAAIAAGIAAGFERQGNTHTQVVAMAGDGATVDIGIQSLSGAMERNDNLLYICYDNEGYMNTGVQGSSSTPLSASTTTTPGGKPVSSKDLFQIVMAHHVPYAATASIANIPDLRKKLGKAKDIKGCRVLHIMSPCPTGWGCHMSKTVEVAREALANGVWVLLEYEGGRLNLGRKPARLGDVEKYCSMQKRFGGVTAVELGKMGEHLAARYEYLEKLSAALGNDCMR